MNGLRLPPGPLGWCLTAALLFGASAPASKRLVEPLGPVLLSGLLYAGAALAVLPVALVRRTASASPASRLAPSPRPAATNRRRLFGAVLFGGVVGPVLLLWGLSLAPAGAVSLWLTLETVATAVLARLLFGADHADSGSVTVDERPTRLRSPADAIAARVAYCSEDRKGEGVVGDLTVRDNLVLALQARRGWARRARRDGPGSAFCSKRMWSDGRAAAVFVM